MYITIVERTEYGVIYLRTESMEKEDEVREEFRKLLTEGRDVFIKCSSHRLDEAPKLNRKERRRQAKIMKPLTIRLQKRAKAMEKKQKRIDEQLAIERRELTDMGVLLLPGTEKLMGGS